MADIERMRAALVAARERIAADRAALIDCHTAPEGKMDEFVHEALAEYDALLAQIDAALAQEAQR